MITCYTGTNGSGKSLHTMRKIYYNAKKRNIITNFPVKLPYSTSKDITYMPNNQLTPLSLLEYAKKNHVQGKESQTLVIIDEAQIIFNCRDFKAFGRDKWLVFFPQHRKLGFDFILITPFIRSLDRQIRELTEYEIKHRKLNRYKIFQYLHIPLFIAITEWTACRNVVLEKEVFKYNKKFANMYDTYQLFSKEALK